MYSLENTFNENREALRNQYVKAWVTDEAFARYDALEADVMRLADSLAGEPHSVIKAKCFCYILENAPIVINPDDWFGITLEATKMAPILDIGCHYQRILVNLSRKWQDELDSSLNPAEDKYFVENTRNYLFNELYIDYNHSTPCWEDIFSLGLCGLIERAEKYRRMHEPLDDKKRAYFDGIEISMRGVIALLKRYSAALSDRKERRLIIMREAIDNITYAPPKNTYEAMLLAWIYWYVQEQVDGIRARTMGALDRLYLDFYRKDVARGVLCADDMEEMLVYFMNGFNALRTAYQQPMYIGGCDETGVCIVNELSYIALRAYRTLAAPNPKLQVIITDDTPRELLTLVLETIREGTSSISIINHNIARESLIKVGATEEEANTYLMSGCWDYAVKNHEVKTVPIRVSLPKILEYTMSGGVCLTTGEQVAPKLDDGIESFDDFMAAFEKQWLYIQSRAMRIIENWESHLSIISPSNLYSGTMTDSLERGVDGYACGMKYNNTIYCVCGLATLVDSLCAIKKYVYDTKEISLAELVEAMKKNWQGYEMLRRKILRDTDKYANGSELADSLMVRLTRFFAEHTNGRPNSRGSIWKLGILSIDKNVRLGALMCATPDGRCAGEPLSKNLSPVIGMDRGGLTTLINSITKIDFTGFPHSAMLDLIVHPSAVAGDGGLCAFEGIVRTYFKKGGHSLQFNVFSASDLIAAQKEPDKYRNLQIRVCGWNVYFVELERVLQDAFIKECLHRESCG